jgi:hypothetical protein
MSLFNGLRGPTGPKIFFGPLSRLRSADPEWICLGARSQSGGAPCWRGSSNLALVIHRDRIIAALAASVKELFKKVGNVLKKRTHPRGAHGVGRRPKGEDRPAVIARSEATRRSRSRGRRPRPSPVVSPSGATGLLANALRLRPLVASEAQARTSSPGAPAFGPRANTALGGPKAASKSGRRCPTDDGAADRAPAPIGLVDCRSHVGLLLEREPGRVDLRV